MNDLVHERITSDSRFNEILNHDDDLNMLVSGINDDFKPVLLYELYQESEGSVVIIVKNNHQMEKLAATLYDMMDDVYTFPIGDIMVENHSKQSPEFKQSRLNALSALAKNESGLFLVPAQALLKPLMSKERLLSYERTIHNGDSLDYNTVPKELVARGYKRMKQAANIGEFAIRGDIIDIYMPSGFYRIELFDDIVDSLREIDPETQRSIKNVDAVFISPFEEFILEESEIEALLEKLSALYDDTIEVVNQEARETLDEYMALINQEDLRHQYLSPYAHLSQDKKVSIIDYIKGHRIIIDELTTVESAYKTEAESVSQFYTSMVEAGRTFKGATYYLEGELERLLSYPRLTFFNLFTKSMPVEIGHILKISVKPTEIYYGQYDILASNLNKMVQDGYLVNIILRDDDELKKTHQMLEDLKIHSYINEIPVKSGIVLTTGVMPQGFILPFMQLAVLTSKELYNKTVKTRKRRQTLSNAEKIKSYQELNVGDYVVHIHHGVGRYMGIETMEVQGIHNDYMKLQYSTLR